MLAEDVLGFIQKIVHEPDKIGKAVIAIAKAALCVIVAERLFFYFIGAYQLIELDSYSAWHEYIMSGRLLICLLLLASSYFALFEILGGVMSFPLRLFQRKRKTADEYGEYRHLVRFVVNILQLLHIDRKTGVVKPAKNTEWFYEILHFLNSKQGEDDIEEFKTSYVSEIWHTYIIFVLYYFIQYAGPSNRWLSVIVVTGAVLLTAIYFGTVIVFNYLQHDMQRLIREIEIVRLQAFAEKAFVDLGFFTCHVTNLAHPGFETSLNFEGKKYSLVYQFRKGTQILTDISLKTITDYINATNEPVMMLTNLKFTQRAQQIINQFSDSLIVFSFTDEQNLTKQLEDFIIKPY